MIFTVRWKISTGWLLFLLVERRGTTVFKGKTEYMCVNERQNNGTVKMQGEEEAKVDYVCAQLYKVIWSVRKRSEEESICRIKWMEKNVRSDMGRRVPAKVKGKVYTVAMLPAMVYGLETMTLRKRQEAEMEVAELKMLRFSLGVTRMDKIWNEYIRGTAQVGRL